MKKIIKILILSILFFNFTTFADDVEDNQVIDALSNSNSNAKELTIDFKLKKFNSCDEMSDVLTEYVKKVSKNRNYRYGGGVMMFDTAVNATAKGMAVDESVAVSNDSISGLGGDFSTTNIQVAGVDEPEIVKTDGKYIYYVVESYDYSTNKQRKALYIVQNDSGNMKVLKKLNLPDHFYGSEMYIQKGKLILIATGYPVGDFQRTFWKTDSAKTYVIVFDTSDISNTKIAKLHMFEGYYTQSRMIGDNLYVIGNKDFYYYNYLNTDKKIEPEDIISKKLDLNYTSDSSKQNVNLKGKRQPYNVEFGDSVKCEDIEYILPDDDTLEKYDFNPSFNIISIINLKNLDKEVTTKVVLGDIKEIHMSKNSLYLTSYLYTNYDFKCGAGYKCMSRYYRGENTLIHKFDIKSNADLSYSNSTIVNGNPLTQYSMDEYDGNFRIITSSWYPDRATNLFVLDKGLNLVSSLTGLAKDENFQSSRFIGDKLYLVTFEQVDPLFVIDIKDIKNPTILGELKIPGYSTYLHPYDDNHLIGLGYDTKENKYGGIQNAGIKIDLYEVNYDKKCGDADLTEEEQKGCKDGTYKGIIVKQLYTKTIGTVGSYSEALSNPRMFVWNSSKKLFLLPATTYEKYDSAKYMYSGFFSGLYAFKIDKDTGIKELFKVADIDESKFEEERKKDCEKYISDEEDEDECTTLINGKKYCPPKNSYIPNYCYADSTVSDYISQNSYKYDVYFTKRALYIGDKVFAISDGFMKSIDMDTYKQVGSVELK